MAEVRVFSIEVCGDTFGIEYHARDWNKAVQTCIRWKEQGLIDDFVLHAMAVQILRQAVEDRELPMARPEQPRRWTFTERLWCLVRDFTAGLVAEAMWLLHLKPQPGVWDRVVAKVGRLFTRVMFIVCWNFARKG